MKNNTGKNISAQAFAALQKAETFPLRLLQRCRRPKHFRSAFCCIAEGRNISAQASASVQNVKTFPLSILQHCKSEKQTCFWDLNRKPSFIHPILGDIGRFYSYINKLAVIARATCTELTDG